MIVQNRCTYVNGNLEGEAYQFWANGNPYVINSYVKGKLHGPQKEFSWDGKLLQTANAYKGTLTNATRSDFSAYVDAERSWGKEWSDKLVCLLQAFYSSDAKLNHIQDAYAISLIH